MSGVLGDFRGAEPHGRVAVAIGERLAAAHSGNGRVLRALLVAQDALARLLMRGGSLDEAFDMSRRSVATAEAVLSSDPKNMQARQDVASGHTLAGHILMRKKAASQAVAEYRRALEMDRRIADDDPGNRSAPRWVASDYMALGVALGQAGDVRAALQSHHEAVARYEALYRMHPDSQMAEFAALGYTRLGDTLASTGDRAAALKEYDRAAVLVARVAATPSTNDDIRRTLQDLPAKIARLRAEGR
jgi:tetratricopeptide (TPR) repeat protein